MSVRTFSVTIKEDICNAEVLLRTINENEVQYMYFQEEQEDGGQKHLQGIIQFKERMVVSSARWFFGKLGIKDAHVVGMQ